MRTVKFYTLGCKVNQYETQSVREQFQKAGFSETENGTPASVCLINTCTVTHRAERDSLYAIRRAHSDNPQAKIVVTGCMAELDKERLKGIAGLHSIIKNKDKNRIVPLLGDIHGRSLSQAGYQSGISYFKNHSRAFLKIQDGCNYQCSYCKVRLARGKSRSRMPREIKAEVSVLVRGGYREIVLCGICLGSYGRDLTPKSDLPKLLAELEAIEGDFRIRLSSIEANDITGQLLSMISGSQRFCRHLHIPLQSGDSRILKLMNRAYSPGKYLALIKRIRRRIPEIAITTDVMVGFPGEKNENFLNTVRLIERIAPMRMHIFPYSKRANTPASKLGGNVSQDSIKSRIAILQALGWGLGAAYSKRFISRELRVYLERRISGCRDLWEGYTDNYIKVRVKAGPEPKRKFIRVRLGSVCDDFVWADSIPGIKQAE
ncbi:tRNA (N(6)-L-threonylcarbamoyladenosine(37)-C(2))-methylthiotransferase MtaB [Candidatus Omnitrophota bacterium]